MRFFISVILLLLSLALFPQTEPYNFSKLDIFSGLSHNQVNTILKDPEGFLWFGTMSGLDRYNGYSFKVYRSNPDVSSSLVDKRLLRISKQQRLRQIITAQCSDCLFSSLFCMIRFQHKVCAYLPRSDKGFIWQK